MSELLLMQIKSLQANMIEVAKDLKEFGRTDKHDELLGAAKLLGKWRGVIRKSCMKKDTMCSPNCNCWKRTRERCS